MDWITVLIRGLPDWLESTVSVVIYAFPAGFLNVAGPIGGLFSFFMFWWWLDDDDEKKKRRVK